MKTIYKTLTLAAAVLFTQKVYSQCASPATLGSASNMLTMIRNGTNPIAVDKNLNTVVLAHRNNASSFGGSSGNIRYDVSMNGGSTWTTNIGPLNPTLTSPARYPNAVIYNPATNTVAANAYLGYLAATINSVSSVWNGYVTGVRQLNGTGNTETYNTTNTNVLIPQSLVKGAPGVFWSVDAVYNGTIVTGFRIYKGTWNGTNDINWATNFTATPALSTAFNGTAQVADYNIAFDPTGTYGWMSFLGHLASGPSNYAYYPIFYKTTDGGASWTGPIEVDINQFPCATSILTTTNVLSTAFEHDLTVDLTGSPHMLTTLCNGNNGYSVYFGYTHHMFDITSLSGVWNAYDLGNVNAGRGGWGTSSTNTVTMDMEPQVSRTADGKKIFFAWTDNTTYTLGAANQSPNLKATAFDVTTLKRTPIKDFTSCSSANGVIYFPHIADEVLEPSATTWKMAGAYAAFTTPNDPGVIASLKYLDNLLFSAADFSITQASVPVSISPGASWLLCPTNTLGLSITGAFTQVLWNNGATTNSTSVNTGSNYIVAVRNGCTIGADTIAVTSLTSNVSTPSICIGNSSTLTIASNAFSYTWSVSNSTASTVVVSPTTTSIYSYTATGTNCTTTQTVSVVVAPLPTLTITGTPTVCAGLSVIQTAGGANTYTWSTGATTATESLSPPSTSVYTVTGTDLNNCVNTETTIVTVMSNPTVSIAGTFTNCSGSATTFTASGAITYTWNTGSNNAAISVNPLSITVYTVTGADNNLCIDTRTVAITTSPLPTVSIAGTNTVCSGSTTTLTASGANTYSWSTGGSAASETVNPGSPTVYTVTGTDANLCVSDQTVSVSTVALPTIGVSTSATLICTGNSVTLTGSGASTYTWNTSQNGNSIVVSPTATTTYTLNGTDANGCSNSSAFTQSVSGCVGVSSQTNRIESLIVYPNPNNGTFTIKSANEISLLIINEIGQVINSTSLKPGETTEIKDLAKGIYFIVETNSVNAFRTKLIVN